MVIVRLVTQNCMVTKGYRKGVYRRVTEETWPVSGIPRMAVTYGRIRYNLEQAILAELSSE